MDCGNVEMGKDLVGKEGVGNGDIHVIMGWEGCSQTDQG